MPLIPAGRRHPQWISVALTSIYQSSRFSLALRVYAFHNLLNARDVPAVEIQSPGGLRIGKSGVAVAEKYAPGPSSRRQIARRSSLLEALEGRLMFARVLGIDISSHQPASIDWNEVKTGNGTTAPGYGWVLTKATEGTQFHDPSFAGYMAGAHAAGIPIGAYDFARWDKLQGTTGADTEAAFFWATVKPYITTGYLMPMLDLEWAGPNYTSTPDAYGYTKTTFSQWAKEWISDITTDAANLTPSVTVTPIIYTGGSFGSAWLDPTILVKTPLIVAAYPSTAPDPQIANPSTSDSWSTWSVWQFTDGSLNNAGYVYGLGGTGLTGRSDADVLQGDIGVLQNFIIGTNGRFAVNTPVTVGTQIASSATLYSNSDTTTSTGTVPIGTTGTITVDSATGLTHAFGNGFWNWHVSFSNGQVGWVHEYETPQNPSPHTLFDWLQGGMVTNVSSSAANGTYNAGKTIPITVTFNGAMTVTGSPNISLSNGGTATYASGSGTNVLTFNYIVGAGQTSSDLDLANGWSAINLNLGTIKDSLGNYPDLMTSVPGATGSLGANKNIIIDTTAPTVTNVTSTSANGAYKAAALIPITVTFSEAVTVTGTPQLSLNSGAVVSYSSGSGTSTLTFNYTVAAGQNASDLNYSSTASLTGTIKDAATNSATMTLPALVAAGSLGTNKNIVVDTVAPTATLPVQTPAGGSGVFDFSVTYADATSGVDGTSIDAGDVSVSGPSYSANATFVSYNSSTGVAVYEIPAPNGIWNAAANGTYTVSQNASQVKDIAGNARASGSIGTFTASIFAYASGTTLVIDYGNTGGAMSLSLSGGNLVVQKGTASAQFLSSSFSSIAVKGGTGNDTFNLDGPVPQTINETLGAGSDTLDLLSGAATFNSDLSSATTALTINASAGTALTFNSSQHLAALNLTGASAVMTAGGANVLVVNALSLTNGAQLDLNDNSAIVDYTGTSPITTIAGWLATGFNAGAWNGAGIDSTAAHNDPSGLHALGYAEAADLGVNLFAGQQVDSTAVLVRYTKYGDNNLDGTVDVGNDFGLFIDGLSGHHSSWIYGDYTYDGTIDLGNDFNLFLRSLLSSGA
jgi:GH25 family lysozyme M1 (1,4-beta-N-acetylmuramidase)